MKSAFKFYAVTLVFLTAFSINSISSQQTFTETPKNSSIKIGEDTILKCTVKNQKGEVVWCKEESFCTFGRKRNFTDSRLSIGGDESKGEHHLVIKNASLIDDTKYQCQVTATDNDASVKSEWAFLTVLIKPTSVGIVSNNKADNSTVRLITNQTTSLECNAENSNPPCSFVWFLDSKELKASTEVSGLLTSNKKQPSKLFKTTGKITLKPLQMNDWQSKTLKCECNNFDSLDVFDTKIVSINYAPILRINKISQDDVLVGSYVQFECIVDSLPPVNNYKWYIDNQVYGSGNDEKYLYLKIEGNMHKKLLKCDAKNEVSTQTASYSIELTYGPKFINELPSHKVVGLNDYLSLTCDVDSNPQSSVIWTLNDTVIYAYSKLVINSVKRDNYGVYQCIASLKDFPKVTSTSIVLPPGPPIIEASQTQYGYFGEPGSIECLFEKEPKATQIDWYKSNQKIDFDKDPNYKLRSEEVSRKGLRSILVFKSILESDFVNYTCQGINAHGSKKIVIKLDPKFYKAKELGNTLPIVVIFLFLFITGTILGFFGYLKFNKLKPSKKRSKKSKNKTPRQTKADRLRSKPSAMLNSVSYRTYPRGHSRYTRNILNRLKNQKFNNNRPMRNYSDLGHSLEIIDPRNLSQLTGNSYDTFNYLNYEYGPNENSNNMNMETSESSFIGEGLDAEYHYLNGAQYHTDV